MTTNAQISFVVTKDKLPFPCFQPYYRSGKNYTYVGYADGISSLDISYYNNQIDKALAKFGVSKFEYMKTSLFDEGRFDKKPINRDQELDTIFLGDL